MCGSERTGTRLVLELELVEPPKRSSIWPATSSWPIFQECNKKVNKWKAKYKRKLPFWIKFSKNQWMCCVSYTSQKFFLNNNCADRKVNWKVLLWRLLFSKALEREIPLKITLPVLGITPFGGLFTSAVGSEITHSLQPSYARIMTNQLYWKFGRASPGNVFFLIFPEQLMWNKIGLWSLSIR